MKHCLEDKILCLKAFDCRFLHKICPVNYLELFMIEKVVFERVNLVPTYVNKGLKSVVIKIQCRINEIFLVLKL